MDYDITREETLRWVNRVREDMTIGPPLDRLPQGVRGCASGCVIGLALHCMALNQTAWFTKVDKMVDYPPAVARFVRLFDRGEFEDLIDYATEEDMRLREELEEA